MGLFSSTPPVPDRADLAAAVLRLDPNDASNLTTNKIYRRCLPSIPDSETILAVVAAHIGDGPSEDLGPLVVSPESLLFFGDRHGQHKIPLELIDNVGMTDGETLVVDYGNEPVAYRLAMTGPESQVFFAEQLRAAIDQAKEAAKTPGVVAPASEADELDKFAKLRDLGAITNEEFEAKMAQVLSSRGGLAPSGGDLDPKNPY